MCIYSSIFQAVLRDAHSCLQNSEKLPDTATYEYIKVLHKFDARTQDCIDELERMPAEQLGLAEWSASDMEILEEAIRSQDPRSLHQIAVQLVRYFIPWFPLTWSYHIIHQGKSFDNFTFGRQPSDTKP